MRIVFRYALNMLLSWGNYVCFLSLSARTRAKIGTDAGNTAGINSTSTGHVLRHSSFAARFGEHWSCYKWGDKLQLCQKLITGVWWTRDRSRISRNLTACLAQGYSWYAQGLLFLYLINKALLPLRATSKLRDAKIGYSSIFIGGGRGFNDNTTFIVEAESRLGVSLLRVASLLAFSLSSLRSAFFMFCCVYFAC